MSHACEALDFRSGTQEKLLRKELMLCLDSYCYSIVNKLFFFFTNFYLLFIFLWPSCMACEILVP